MTIEYIMILFHEATKIILMISTPLLLSTLTTGLIISILQAVTQVNEQTLSFIPKFLTVLMSFMIFGPWMLNLIIDYMRSIFYNIILITN